MKPTERDLQVARAVLGRVEQAFGIEWSVDLPAVIAALPEPEPGPVDRDLLRQAVMDSLDLVRERQVSGPPIGDYEVESIIDCVLAEHTPAAESEQHPDRQCCDCGQHFGYIWFAKGGLWERVIGSPNGVLCATCFAKRAESLGLNVNYEAVVRDHHLTDDPAPAATGRSPNRQTSGIVPAAESEYERGVREERERWRDRIENTLACMAPPSDFMTEVASWLDDDARTKDAAAREGA